jgi:hypothetical protein
MGASTIGRRAAKVSTQDGRCAEARLLRKTRAGFVAHLGGKPSATQAALIDRASMLTVHLARMDAKARETGEFSDHAGRQYLAWSSALARLVRQLGMDAAPTPKPPALTPREILAAERAETVKASNHV